MIIIKDFFIISIKSTKNYPTMCVGAKTKKGILLNKLCYMN